jgi:hypothetical protein
MGEEQLRAAGAVLGQLQQALKTQETSPEPPQE